MRFVTRIMLGAGAATLLATGAPAMANAETAVPVQTVTATTPYFADTWGPYTSGDERAEAEGKVTVEKKAAKHWYWKKYSKVVKKCTWHHGKKKCDWVKKWYKKHVWKWTHEYHYTVDSTLTNHKWWGKSRHSCAWETFKVVGFDGSTDFTSFKNCSKKPAHYSFDGKNAEHIYVKVSRGHHGHPNGYQSGWKPVYHHA
ncbi:hypothetical protein ACLQ2R_38490 [Streptosporangium sp. DT93]|uniref:hypothetical protein n=1 Tax=Streptosporangium sp. DT93 TaxID=3393428 RepID=UPI003CE76938